MDETTSTEHLRRLCYLQRRKRPICPHFENSPVPQHTAGQAEQNARITLTYFRAWTLNATNASDNVPFAGRLKQTNQTWAQALRSWLTLLPCEDTKRYVGNFLSVYRVRPSDADAANSDDSGVDEPLLVTPATLPMALTTAFRQTGKQKQTKTGAELDDVALASYKAAVAQAEVVWPQASHTTATKSHNPYEMRDPKEVQKAIKSAKAKRKSKRIIGNSTSEQAAGTWQREAQDIVREVGEFVTDVRQKHMCNDEQLEFLEKVCERIQAEAVTGQDRGGAAETNTEPLRWALHGGPGTGKSYVLNLLRKDLFEKRLGWQQGQEFQIVTFQAVNAEPLDGDTIHSALGLAWHGNDSNVDAQRILDLAGNAIRWRWLLIDEISMVSAEMLARLEARCRQLVQDLCATKYANQNKTQTAPFGGLNVILSGDLWQLPPPRGTFLGQIPWQLVTSTHAKKLPLTLQGQQLVWASATEGGLQGVTELVQCERTQDKWLQELQAELRTGHLSENNHGFLHGRPTTVPGSWLEAHKRPICGEVTCQQLHAQSIAATTITQKECTTCQAERASKRLVAYGPDDPPFANELARAQAIFSTNVVKCHVNRIRAEQWARLHRQRLYYAIAQDLASSQALRAKPDLAKDKLSWLQRSDADCGDRCGVLPLCMGMPVRAREHIYRGDFKILRGCHGVVCGWSATKNEHETAQKDIIWNKLPEYTFVRLQTRTEWQLPGIDEKNVFPVRLARKPWYLDAGRANPKLKVTRSQFPLAPDFAGTTHALQGCTAEHGAIVDIPANPDPIAVCVGMTRCRTRDKLMIYRPFPLTPLQAGLPLGRQLLLDVWKQERIDWEALRKKYLDERPCMECNESKRKDAFTKSQWRQDGYRVCKECTAHKRDAGTPYRCSQCGVWHATSHFPSKHLNPRWSPYRTCFSCEAKKQCLVCQKSLTKECFSAAAWRCKQGRRKCLTCQCKTRGLWTCAGCQQRKQRDQYRTFLRRHPSGENGQQMCDACYTRQAQCRKRQRIAAKCNVRVASLRQRIHREHILQEIKDLIASEVHARKRLAQTASGAQETTAAKRPKQSASVVAPHAAKPNSSIEPPQSTVPCSNRRRKRQARQGQATEGTQKKRKTETPQSATPTPHPGHSCDATNPAERRPRSWNKGLPLYLPVLLSRNSKFRAHWPNRPPSCLRQQVPGCAGRRLRARTRPHLSHLYDGCVLV